MIKQNNKRKATTNKNTKSNKKVKNNNDNNPFKQHKTINKETVDYAHNIFNPFIRTGARIPHSPIVSSQMVTTFAKGVFNTNAAGLGFIQVAPMRGIASDGNLGNVTSNLYAGTTFPAFGTAFTALLNTNSPYTLADFDVADDTCLSARVVSAGIRIRFVGTELNKGGRVYGLDSEGHFSLIGRDLTSVA